jgi:hypothetical protein
MEKPNDEGRGVEALQEAESRQFALNFAHGASGDAISDRRRDEERSAGQVPASERPVVEEHDSERPDAVEEQRPRAPRRRRDMWESTRGRLAVVPLAVLKDADDGGRLDRVSLLLAVLLFFSPWMMGFTDLTIVTQAAWISALVVAIVSAAATLHFSEWEEWVNFLAGVWIIATPWILHFHKFGNAVAAFISIGVIITTIALSELWEAHHPGYKPI